METSLGRLPAEGYVGHWYNKISTGLHLCFKAVGTRRLFRDTTMLISDHVLFLHPPKTAGISITEFLLKNLPGQKILTVPNGHANSNRVQVVRGIRHETLPEAVDRLSEFGRSLSDFDVVLAVIRNPYDLEVSRYHYLRKSDPADAGLLQQLALTGDFDRFARQAPYPFLYPRSIEQWYTLDGRVPSNVRLARFENLQSDLSDALRPYCSMRRRLPHLNASGRGAWPPYITRENEPYLYSKYQWLFRFYDRAHFDSANGADSAQAEVAAYDRSIAAHKLASCRMDRFRTEVMPHVAGQTGALMLDVVEAIGAAQEVLGVTGSALEIGVLQGQFLLALATLLEHAEPIIAIDLFEKQDLNTEASGIGNKAKLQQNVQRFVDDPRRVRVIESDSLALDAEAVRALRASLGPARLISLDGGLSLRHTQHDLGIAARMIAEGGVVFLSQAFNGDWPGVNEALARMMLSDREPPLVPLLSTTSKLALCRPQDCDQLRQHLIATLARVRDLTVRPVTVYGQPVWNIRHRYKNPKRSARSVPTLSRQTA